MASTATIKILMDLEDRVTGQMKNIDKSLDGFSKGLASMGPGFTKMAAVGTASFAAISAAVGLSVASYGEAERSARQLQHAVVDVSKGTQEQVKAISDLSDALQLKSGIDGDALKMGAAQLSTFGLQSKSVVDLTKSLADLTVNQNGVNASSDQYVQSANVIAKALNGQFGVLEKSGIRFTEQQQAMILNGKEAEKVAALQAGLAQNLRETTDTLGGVDQAAARASRAFGEISESIGKAFAPALASVLNNIAPLLQKIADFIGENPKLTITIVAVTAAVSGIIAVAGTLGMVLTGLSGAAAALGITLTVFLGWLLLIPAAIAAIVAIGYVLYTHWDQVKALANQLWQEVVAAWEGIKNGVTSAMQAVSDFLSATWQMIVDIFWTSVDFIIGAVKMFLDFFFPGWETNFMLVLELTMTILNQLYAFFISSFTMIKAVFNEALTWISTKWTTVWNSLKDAFMTIWNVITGLARSAFDAIKADMEALIAPIQRVIDLAQKAYSLASKVVGGAVSGVSSFVSTAISTGASITGRATGGSVLGGNPYVVGENGPELFVPGRSGTIIPNGGMGGVTIVLTGNSFIGADDLAEKAGDIIWRELNYRMRTAI